MDLTRPNLQALFTGFQTAFQNGLSGTAGADAYRTVAMVVNSTHSAETYGWMKDIPSIREWVGPRVIHSLDSADYTIKNKPWELTIGVDRHKIEDDSYGLYTPFIAELGQSGARFPNKLVFELLKDGFSTRCWDGQYFFDTDHPVIDADGSTVSVSNMQTGSGAPWFLMDLSRTIKPIVFQSRKPFDFTRMDADTDEVVFDRNEYRYGTAGRCNVGYGFWQLAFGSKATLDKDSYQAARAAMGLFKRDYGEPLDTRGTHLVCGPSNEGRGLAVLKALNAEFGQTNVWAGTAQLVVVPWLG